MSSDYPDKLGYADTQTWATPNGVLITEVGLYTTEDIQNEVLQIMALSILREISSSIRESGWFTIMADE